MRMYSFIIVLLCSMYGSSVSMAQTDDTGERNKNSRLDSLQNIQEVEVYGKRPLATSQTLRGKDLQALSTTILLIVFSNLSFVVEIVIVLI